MEPEFCKYHGLGNDYIVLDPATFPYQLTENAIRRICDRHRGVGSDGILFGPIFEEGKPPQVFIYNPDGSEAEKSGNGVRIFARYLLDRGYVSGNTFSILTRGGRVTVHLERPDASLMTVDMGALTFDSEAVGATGPKREVIDEEVDAGGERFRITAVSIGNPHCVVFRDAVTAEEAHRLGPLFENHGLFPKRINVQFAQVLARDRLRIEIWERGAAYTLASGTSSCAAAGAARKTGRCGDDVTVVMPGGELRIRIAEDWSVRMTGPVEGVHAGNLADDVRRRL